MSILLDGLNPTSETFQGILSQPQNLSGFVGCYGMTVIVPLDNPVAKPMLEPQLNVAINNSVPSVQLNLGNGQILQIPIDDFNPELNRLTWTDSSPVSSSGALDFGSQTEPTAASSYIGNYLALLIM